jgi:excisionase family DNA binding protein
MHDTKLFTTSETAALLRVQTTTLAAWRCTRRHDLPYVKVGGRVAYRQSDLDAWLTARTSAAAVAVVE